jgi:hypothetical protein
MDINSDYSITYIGIVDIYIFYLVRLASYIFTVLFLLITRENQLDQIIGCL